MIAVVAYSLVSDRPSPGCHCIESTTLKSCTCLDHCHRYSPFFRIHMVYEIVKRCPAAGFAKCDSAGQAPENTMTASFCRPPAHMCRACYIECGQEAAVREKLLIRPCCRLPALTHVPRFSMLSYAYTPIDS